MSASVLVLSGDGMNCERESARAFSEAGGKVTILHVNELLKSPEILLGFKVLCVPGGFSFGDELRSGKILAEKLREHVLAVFKSFTVQGGLTLGICNGFQVLIQLGVFGVSRDEREITLATNNHGTFLNQWVELEVTPEAKKSPWFSGIDGNLLMPMRHKEGRLVLKAGVSSDRFRFPLRYLRDVNGSHQQAAALLDPSGQILGVMPHPEAATQGFLNALAHLELSPQMNADKVKRLFINAVRGNQAC